MSNNIQSSILIALYCKSLNNHLDWILLISVSFDDFVPRHGFSMAGRNLGYKGSFLRVSKPYLCRYIHASMNCREVSHVSSIGVFYLVAIYSTVLLAASTSSVGTLLLISRTAAKSTNALAYSPGNVSRHSGNATGS